MALPSASMNRRFTSPTAPRARAWSNCSRAKELSPGASGFGRQSPNDWGLGVELRGHTSPHWTPAGLSPRAFGHIGQSGAFLWVDPSRGLGLVAATDTAFGPWAAQAWPRTSTRVLTSAALLDRRSS